MSLEGTLEVTVANGTPTLAFTVRNASDGSVEVQFSDGCKAEFVVETDGEERWRFTAGRMFTQVLSTETLGPGEETTYEATCEPLEPGRYTATAELRAVNRTSSARTTFSV